MSSPIALSLSFFETGLSLNWELADWHDLLPSKPLGSCCPYLPDMCCQVWFHTGVLGIWTHTLTDHSNHFAHRDSRSWSPQCHLLHTNSEFTGVYLAIPCIFCLCWAFFLKKGSAGDTEHPERQVGSARRAGSAELAWALKLTPSQARPGVHF